MHRYFIRTPWIIKQFFFPYIWKINTRKKEIFLTFDDGPHPQITPWVLNQLKKYDAKATFFCVGNNVKKYPSVYEQVIAEGHAVGNHTYDHLNGWKTDTQKYMANITKAAALVSSGLFRPPYGRIKRKQAKQLPAALNNIHTKIIMWDVLSADFDQGITKEKCLENVLHNYREGSIVVFHDSEKAFPHLQFALPKILQHLQQEDYICRKIECIR
jgi:peptidoglycan/xylan/chitin deacetylase (PgdA/CDA1 family)